ncbi:MAG: quaternary ammonium compound efflux SMR transporter SugE [Bryobacterales bacterium]|nr:quaternary ammonium compound efflux SMR transporter SugE [Bryobacterales bacterium]
MDWFLLAVAGALEIVWAAGLKYTAGFTRFWPSAITAAAMLASIFCLGLAVRTLPLGTAYAVWTGIGTAGTAIAGIALFSEPASLLRLTCLFLILAAIAGLKLSTHP